MTWFQSFRNEYGFTFYGDESSPVSLDKPLLIVVYLCVLVSGATLIATLGIRGREKWSHALRASYSVAIASIILVCLVSHDWMEGRVRVAAPFVYRSNMHFSGDLAVRIGLRSANITLDGTYKSPTGSKLVYYEETLPWPDFGTERSFYRSQMQRGLPAPLLRVMDFLTYNHGELQWGKSFHTAGHFAWVLLWTAFVFWLLSNILLFSVVVYGAYTFFLTGVAMIMACVAFSQSLNGQPLHMTFGQEVLRLEYGWSFWLAIVAGCLTTLLGVLLIVSDIFVHHKVADFFHLEKELLDDEFCSPDYSKMKMNGARFSQDGGNSKLGFPNARKGSIFLEPERQTNWTMNPLGVKDNPLKTWNQNGSGGDDNVNRKLRSMSQGSNDDRDRRTPQQQPHDRKPSLATLREHSENHANERKSNSSAASCSSASISSSSSSSPKPNNVDTAVYSNSTGSQSSLQSPTSAVRSPTTYERFLDDTAKSIRLRSSNSSVSNSNDDLSQPTSPNPDRCARAIVEVEAVVEKQCCVGLEEMDDEGVYSQKESRVEEEESSTARHRRSATGTASLTSSNMEFDFTSTSAEGDNGVFCTGGRSANFSDVSRSDTGNRDGITVVEVVSTENQNGGHLHEKSNTIASEQVSIPIERF